jgi:hypothetical protein
MKGLIMKKLILLILIVSIIPALSACGSSSSELALSAGDSKIGYVTKSERGSFKTIMDDSSGIEVPYIKIGETIRMEFKGKLPDVFLLRDRLIGRDGSARYTEKEIKEVTVEFTDGAGSFKLDIHNAVFLSSDAEDYQPGNTFRGFELICRWGVKETTYYFVVRTDTH